ncbi:Baseplate J family protein [Rhodoplanes serenus]|uniref:Baseplate J family protein n=1 Tax=Rhodoplanes serenus TaxID=200615 RepID=A0A9X5AU70_9BRAD|nr:baseplate J/gp47 family protein [Rhodoplanes serenus]MTW19352.1 Baseplate J family protein [Rhodoplanes serenus]
MPYPIPTPEELIRRQEARMEAAILAARPDASPVAVARAVRSPRGIVAALLRVQAMELYELHLHLAWWGRQYLPDTAADELIERHGDIWGVYRRPATRAVGAIEIQGTPGVAIAAGAELQSVLGRSWTTTAGGIIPAEGTLVLDVVAAEPGPDGNLAGGTALSLVVGIAGLTAIVTGQEGLAGGADRESLDDLRGRILDLIRAPAYGGNAADYQSWVRNSFAASHVRAIGTTGSVTVVVAMGTRAAPRVPTTTEIAAIAEHLAELAPLGMADLFVVPATLREVHHHVAIDPDDLRVREGIAAALAITYARDAAIGGTVRRSRLSEAISSADGEYAHQLLAPMADIVCAPTELPVPGDITWGAL